MKDLRRANDWDGERGSSGKVRTTDSHIAEVLIGAFRVMACSFRELIRADEFRRVDLVAVRQ